MFRQVGGQSLCNLPKHTFLLGSFAGMVSNLQVYVAVCVAKGPVPPVVLMGCPDKTS